MNGNGRRTLNLAALRARRERLEGAAYRGKLAAMTDAEFAAELRAEMRLHFGAVVDAMTDAQVAEAADDLWLAELEARADTLDVDERATLIQLRQYRHGPGARPATE